MKTGWVTPLLKKVGLDTSDFKNFRPITNLSTFSKILERLAQNRLKHHITQSPNFGQFQSAYRQGHSTETALTKMMDDILTAVDNGSVVALMSLDISAAFDAVNHDILVQRLSDEFGIVGNLLRSVDPIVLDWSLVRRACRSVIIGCIACPIWSSSGISARSSALHGVRRSRRSADQKFRHRLPPVC